MIKNDFVYVVYIWFWWCIFWLGYWKLMNWYFKYVVFIVMLLMLMLELIDLEYKMFVV